MPLTIGSNIASLLAQRRLGQTTSALETVFERLASGQRINRASDDAAGLAIADSLRVDARIYNQGIRNANDGISLLNIADSAVASLTDIVGRIQELAQQSANGTFSAQQRQAIDAEAQALSQEFSRIKNSTSFNDISVLAGDLGQGMRIQLGYGLQESILARIGGAVSSGTFSNGATLAAESEYSYEVAVGDLNGDGIQDLVSFGNSDAGDGYATVRLGNGDGSFLTGTTYSTESGASFEGELADLNNDSILDLISAGETDGGSGIVTVRLGVGNGSFGSATSYSTSTGSAYGMDVGDLNGDGILDILTVGDAGPQYFVTRLGNGDGTFGSTTSYGSGLTASSHALVYDINSDGYQDMVASGEGGGAIGAIIIRYGTGGGGFGGNVQYSGGTKVMDVEFGDVNGDGFDDMIAAGYTSGNDGFATVRLASGTGTFATSATFITETLRSANLGLADFNSDGLLDIVTTGSSDANVGYTTLHFGNGNGTFSTQTSYLAQPYRSSGLDIADLNGDGVLDIISSGRTNGPTDGYVNILLGDSFDGVSDLQDFSLATQASSLAAMSTLSQAYNNLIKQRGVIGASQSRIQVATNGLMSKTENLISAESRIRESDVARDAAELFRLQILQESSRAILSQSNQGMKIVLQLLDI